jgi:hypothetical protein
MTPTHCDICIGDPRRGITGQPCRYPYCELGQAGDPPVPGGPSILQPRVQTPAPAPAPVHWHDAAEPNLTDVAPAAREGIGFEIGLVLTVIAFAFAAAVWVRENWPAPVTHIAKCPTPITGEVLVVTIARGDGGQLAVNCSTARGRTPGKAS